MVLVFGGDFDSLEFLKLGRCLVREKRECMYDRYRIKSLTIFLRVMQVKIVKMNIY